MKNAWIGILVFCLSSKLFSQENFRDLVKFGIYGRIRGEGFDDFGFTSERGQYDYVGSKFNLTLESGKEISSKWNIFFQPQFVKFWAVEEYLPVSTSENLPVPTSGWVEDTRLSVHQAYIHYRPWEKFGMKFGRQILSYADELLIGALDWNNVGRSFDALKFYFIYPQGIMDLFFSKLIEPSPFNDGPGHYYLLGLYNSSFFQGIFKNSDLYALYKKNDFLQNQNYVLATGVRVKALEGRIDHRLEATYEIVNNPLGRFTEEYQIDLELGYLIQTISTRISVEFFQASKFFDQFFPGFHKWLGFADQFGRRNIKGFVLGLRPKFSDNFEGRLDFHSFSRTDNKYPVYTLGGNLPYPDTSKSPSYTVAEEIDLVFYWNLEKGLNIELGGSYVVPKGFMRTLQNSKGLHRDQAVTFFYLAMETKF